MRAPDQRHAPRRLQRRSGGDDRRARPLAGSAQDGDAAGAPAQNGAGLDGLGHFMDRRHDGVGHGAVGGAALAFDDLAVDVFVLRAAGDAVHHRHGGFRIGAGSRFRRQHHRIGAFIDRLRHVRDFGAGRHRRGDHRFQHLGRHHHRLAGFAGGAQDALLQPGHGFQRHLDAQIAARHHQRVHMLQDFVQALHRLGFLDLGEASGAALHDPVQFDHVLGPLHEGKRDPVHAQRQRRFQVGMVLGRHRRQRQQRVGHVHALAVLDLARHLDRGLGEIVATA